MRRIADNLLSGYVYLGLMALITIFVVPIYVHTLGATTWGSVAWCLTLQGLLFALDAALAPLMLRDIAHAAAAGRLRASHARFLAIHGRLALGLCVLGQIALSLWAHAPDGTAPPQSTDTVVAMRLALVQFLFQFSNLAAIGFWHGQQRQRMANASLAAFALAKHSCALLLITQWTPTATAYMLPFAIVSAVEFLSNRRRVQSELKTAIVTDVHESSPSGWQDIFGYGVAAALGIATTQIDRLFLSRSLPVESFGLYFLVGSLMLSLMHLQMPVQRTFLPRLATSDEPLAVAAAMLKVSLVLLALPLLVLAVFSESVLALWLHDAALARQGALTLRVLMFAAALHVLAGPAQLLLLNARRYRLIAGIHTLVLAAQLAVLMYMAADYGMLAGAAAWLVSGSVQLLAAVAIWRGMRHVSAAADQH